MRGSKNALHCAKRRSPSSYFLDTLVWLEVKTGSAIVNRQKHESSVLKNTLNLLPHEDILNAGTLGGTIWLPAFSSINVVKFVFVLDAVKGKIFAISVPFRFLWASVLICHMWLKNDQYWWNTILFLEKSFSTLSQNNFLKKSLLPSRKFCPWLNVGAYTFMIKTIFLPKYTDGKRLKSYGLWK